MPENSKKPRIVVLNTRAANVHSVEKALRKVGADPIVTSDPEALSSADAAVLPGKVHAFPGVSTGTDVKDVLAFVSNLFPYIFSQTI